MNSKYLLTSLILLFFTLLTSQSVAYGQPAARVTNFQQRREALKDRLNQMRQQIDQRNQAKRDALREKLGQISDEKKKALVERINNNMNAINERATTRMAEALEKLTAILTRIENKAKQAAQNGSDTSIIDQAITDAKTAIKTAEAAVEAQAGKDYTLQIGDETTLRQNVAALIQSIRIDLKATWQTVQDAKEVVKKAARLLHDLRPTATTALPTTSP